MGLAVLVSGGFRVGSAVPDLLDLSGQPVEWEVREPTEKWEPRAHFPDGDAPLSINRIDHQDPGTIGFPSYTWTYTFAGDPPDIEPVTIDTRFDKVWRVQYRVHNEWVEEYEFTQTQGHVDVWFTPVYHTPYISKVKWGQRAAGILLPFILGAFVVAWAMKP